MARDKTYVCFDADTDIHLYRLMTAWHENERFDFNFENAHDINTLRKWSSEETIKTKLRERLKNTKVLVVLIGENTKNLYKYVRWEIEYAIENDIPIIAVNLNGARSRDSDLCPPLLKDELAIHISYGPKIMHYALEHWPSSHESHKAKKEIAPYSYKSSVYENLK